jgi:hypothetical protein
MNWMDSLALRSGWAALIFAALPSAACFAASLEVSVSNPLAADRSNETVELSLKDLSPLGAANLNLIHVKDPAGKELVCQAIDLDGDSMRKFDAVLFQSDFKAGETRKFMVSVGGKQLYSKENYKAFGRFVRERFDDFVWENDRIAHRTYGKALETWEGEPLSSSTVDVWSKRSPRMVVNDWYLSDDYHVDHGEGGDFYSAGLSRGCGGNGLWAGERLWTSRNFVQSHVLGNGPIRVLFELTYEPFTVDQTLVSEVKRIQLDAGSQFGFFQSTYKVFQTPGKNLQLISAAGLKKVAGENLIQDEKRGWMAKWEKVEKGQGHQGLAVVSTNRFSGFAEDPLNHLLLAELDDVPVASYWAGFCWDQAGLFESVDKWTRHVREFADAVSSPLQIKIRSIEP